MEILSIVLVKVFLAGVAGLFLSFILNVVFDMDNSDAVLFLAKVSILLLLSPVLIFFVILILI